MFVELHDSQECISKLELGKAVSFDGIHNEHIIYGCTHLFVHLCLLFNALLWHCIVPSDFCVGVVIPLLKNKHRDQSNLDMYRGITVARAISIILRPETEIVLPMCRRLGELLRQEQERVRQMKLEGHEVYLQYVQQGRDAKISKQVTNSDSGCAHDCIAVHWNFQHALVILCLNGKELHLTHSAVAQHW